MSAQPDIEPIHVPELRIITSADLHNRENEIRQYALMRPEQVYERANTQPELIFKVAQLALSHTIDCQEKIRWIGVMHKSMSPPAQV
jgi:hypothetical protein